MDIPRLFWGLVGGVKNCMGHLWLPLRWPYLKGCENLGKKVHKKKKLGKLLSQLTKLFVQIAAIITALGMLVDSIIKAMQSQ